MSESALAKIEKSIFNRHVNPVEAAEALVLFSPSSRAIAIRASYETFMANINKEHASDAAEHAGRRLESVLDGLPSDEFEKTLRQMIDDGDTELVLKMLAGRVGEVSSVAEHLTVDLLISFFENDPDMNETYTDERGNRKKNWAVIDARLVNVAWTLIMETPREAAGITQFFLHTDEGRDLVRQLEVIVDAGETEDEEIRQILDELRNRGYSSEGLVSDGSDSGGESASDVESAKVEESSQDEGSADIPSTGDSEFEVLAEAVAESTAEEDDAVDD